MRLRLSATIVLCIGLLSGPAFAQRGQDFAAEAQQAYDSGDYSACAQLYSKALEKGSQDASLLYDAACCYALSGSQDSALQLLDKAIDAGFWNAGHMSRDEDLTSLHSDPRWAATMQKASDAQEAHKKALSTPLKFDRNPSQSDSALFTFSSVDDPYLLKLRSDYKLSELVAKDTSDYQKLLTVSHWAHTQWEHNGQNQPTSGDPITILQEAAQGKQFRCVEYSEVLCGALNSLGIPTRVLSLKTGDVETRPSGAGHVVTEAYLRDLDKWVMIDPQWDAIPLLDETPLNAVELQRALAEGKAGLTVDGFSGTEADTYFPWIQEYLFYFDTPLDNRYGVDTEPGSLMLVPLGAKNPVVFQQKYPITSMFYTHSVEDFYPHPEMDDR
jgi:tetratricopeptide (TPR) repeat protein